LMSRRYRKRKAEPEEEASAPSPYELVRLYVNVLETLARYAELYNKGAILTSEYAAIKSHAMEVASNLAARIRKAFKLEEDRLRRTVGEIEELPEEELPAEELPGESP